jgi:D-alanine transaminase
MPRFAYVNGRYVPHGAAQIHIEDRGFQFADSVYEVMVLAGGQLLDERGHLDRLERSLGELRIAMPMSRRVLSLIVKETVRRNATTDGLVYLQISRGRAPRDFAFPRNPSPSVVVTVRARRVLDDNRHAKGIAVITLADLRWKRRDIKTTGLLAQVLAKQRAVEAGAQEAWMIDDQGLITEASSANAWIVSRGGRLMTRQADQSILKGVTRSTLQALCAAHGIAIEERPFSLAEAKDAAEAFISSASHFATPVIRIDDCTIGTGEPGPLTTALRRAYFDYIVKQAETPTASVPWRFG